MWAAVVCALASGLLSLWGLQRASVLLSALRAARAPATNTTATNPTKTTATPTPTVTVQVPLFNEPEVCVRAVDAACALRWPDLEVQILDDSTDGTVDLVAAAVARHRAAGVDVVHIHRANRDQFKAGALQHGLSRARGDWVAMFDADFCPTPDFLERTLPRLVDSGADMAQTRWAHLNRDASWLTRAQAALLDAHFAVEQQGRAFRGRFFGFNGTAGIWRKRTIEDAGGWSGESLTEDLDLSLRAHLNGARFVYFDDVTVAAELPTSMSALRVQQHRWAKGAMQTARARLGDVWRAPVSVLDKLDLTLKLTQNFSFVLLSLIVWLFPLAVLERLESPSLFAFAAVSDVEFAGVVFGTLPALVSVTWAVSRCGRGPIPALCDAVLGLGLAAALSAHAALAALAGLLSVGSTTFARTPKTGGRRRASAVRLRPLLAFEAALSGVYLLTALWLCQTGRADLAPLLAVAGAALATTSATSFAEAFARLRENPLIQPTPASGRSS